MFYDHISYLGSSSLWASVYFFTFLRETTAVTEKLNPKCDSARVQWDVVLAVLPSLRIAAHRPVNIITVFFPAISLPVV